MLMKYSYGIHLAKVNIETGEVLSNWTNLWNGTGGIVRIANFFMHDWVADADSRLQKVPISSKKMAGTT
jgi:hypothetical protein